MATQKVGKIRSPHKDVLDYFEYNPETGILSWKKSPKYKPQFTPGRRAGYPDKDSTYRRVTFQGVEYAEHRFIHFWMTGKNTRFEIDHKDGDGSNNKWSNLRKATSKLNQANRRVWKPNRLGYRGVHEIKIKDGSVRYYSMLGLDYLGTFDSPEAAFQKYCEENTERFGEYFCSENTNQN